MATKGTGASRLRLAPMTQQSPSRRRREIPDRIERYYIPLSVVQATQRVMRRFGREKRECYVWWGGYFTTSGEAQVVSALWPDVSTEYGCVHLKTSQLLAVHEKLRTLDQILLIELHTHPPGAGGQNDVDAAHPAAIYRGFVSIVVPAFGSRSFRDLRKTHVYEYLGNGDWSELKTDEIGAKFLVEETIISVRT